MGTPNCVPCPFSTVTATLAENRSARPVTGPAACSRRHAAAWFGSVNMSRTVVTPKFRASSRAGPKLWVWASISPGSRVMPDPSTTVASSPAAGGSASLAVTASMVRPRTVTVAVSSTSSPVKTVAPRMTMAGS